MYANEILLCSRLKTHVMCGGDDEAIVTLFDRYNNNFPEMKLNSGPCSQNRLNQKKGCSMVASADLLSDQSI